ncbi:MAG: OB-fold domain-containing protein, partial [Acidimicrobiia bacterium]
MSAADNGRPLPYLDPHYGAFWTSGADGVLRIQSCATCGALRHPPAPSCYACGSLEATWAEVSGTATVVGFTINHHRWHPAFDPPYALAIVALDEDDGVRLTTQIVATDLDAIRVGMRVTVQFESVDDVWLPVFTAIPGEPDAATAPDPDIRHLVRPRLTERKFEADSAITGVGASQTGRRLMRDPLSLTVEASLRAIADAGLTVDDIDGLCSYPGPDGWGHGHSEGGIGELMESMHLRPSWINGAPETPGQSGSIVAAMMAVSAGLCRHVLCFRTVWESTLAVTPTPHHAGDRITGNMGSAFRLPYGAFSAASWIGMYAHNYMHHYGMDRETLGWIAVTSRANAALNPDAVYRDPMSMDDYLSARMISTPFGLYDCDVPCDASIAVIVSAIDTARDRPHPPIRIEAVGTQLIERLSWDQGTLTHEPQVMGPAAHLWTRTDLRQSDVDVALLYDGFTFNCLSWIEALG